MLKLISIVAITLIFHVQTYAFTINEFVPNIVDSAHVLSAAEIQQLNIQIEQIRNQGHIFSAVYLVPTVEPDSIEEVAVQTFQKWKLGQKRTDNGLLIIAAIEDHKVRIEVGYGLEGSLPDIQARHVIDTYISPNFKNKNYFGGISQALKACNDIIQSGDPIKLNPTSSTHRSTHLSENVTLRFFLWLFLILVIPAYLRKKSIEKAKLFAKELRPTKNESLRIRVLLGGPDPFGRLIVKLFSLSLLLRVTFNSGITDQIALILVSFIEVAFSSYEILSMYWESGRRKRFNWITKSHPTMTRDNTIWDRPRWRRGNSGFNTGSDNNSGGFSSSSSGGSSSSDGGSSGGGGASGDW